MIFKLIAIFFLVNCLFSDTPTGTKRRNKRNQGVARTNTTEGTKQENALTTKNNIVSAAEQSYRKMDDLRAIRIRVNNKYEKCEDIVVKDTWKKREKRCTNYGCVYKNDTDKTCSSAENAVEKKTDGSWKWTEKRGNTYFKENVTLKQCKDFVKKHKDFCTDYFNFEADKGLCECVPRNATNKKLMKKKNVAAYEFLSACESIDLPPTFSVEKREGKCIEKGCAFNKNTLKCADLKCRDIKIKRSGLKQIYMGWEAKHEFCGGHDCIFNPKYSTSTCDEGKCEDIELPKKSRHHSIGHWDKHQWCKQFGCGFDREHENQCATVIDTCVDLSIKCRVFTKNPFSFAGCKGSNSEWYEKNCQKSCGYC